MTYFASSICKYFRECTKECKIFPHETGVQDEFVKKSEGRKSCNTRLNTGKTWNNSRGGCPKREAGRLGIGGALRMID